MRVFGAAKICGSNADDIDRIIVKGFCNEASIVNVEIFSPEHEVKVLLGSIRVTFHVQAKLAE